LPVGQYALGTLRARALRRRLPAAGQGPDRGQDARRRPAAGGFDLQRGRPHGRPARQRGGGPEAAKPASGTGRCPAGRRPPSPPERMTPSGILLMTYGSATTADGVAAYLRSVHQGREPSAGLVAEFERRYRLVRRSPLIDITLAQAVALQDHLDQRFGPGRFRVAAGMLHSEPGIEAAVDGLVRGGAREVLAITLAPQFSPVILAGYTRTLERIAGQRRLAIRMAGAWHREPALIASLSGRLRSELEAMPA